MTLISGPEPGYYTDIIVWRDCDVIHDLEEIMHEREANGLCRLKLYADKLYNTSMLENAVSKYYHVAVLLSNCYTCLYGGSHLLYFGVEPLTLEEYFNMPY